jgi:hypothetical protein
MQPLNITSPYCRPVMVRLWDKTDGQGAGQALLPAEGEPDMPSLLRCAAVIGTLAFFSPVHERATDAPVLPQGLDLGTALKTVEAAKSAGQALAALDPDTRARLLAHVAATVGAGEAAPATRKPAKP